MTTELLEIMQKDIKRCEEAQDSNEGTHRLYQALIAKYNGIFEGFEKDIPTSGKAAFGGGEFNYRPELNAIKEKLELLIVTDNDKDPLFNFKVMYILKLRETFPGQTIFGRSDVMKAIDIKASRASDLLKEMVEHGIIEPVYGHGKGKYHFLRQ